MTETPKTPDVPVATEPPPARVQKVGDWHLVTYQSWQISVDPAGLPMLPRHLHPRDWADFAGCMQVAVDVGNQIIAANEEKQKAQEAKGEKTGLSSRKAIVTQGPPPQGSVRMRTTSAQQRAASIGRAKRRNVRRTTTAAPAKPGRNPTRRET